jgi:hypothetical protein
MKKALLVIPVILAILLSSCASKMTSATAMPDIARESLAQGGAPAQAPKALDMASGFTSNSSVENPAITTQINRIVIKTATLTIVVDDPSITVTAISNMAEGMGGFVVSSNVYQTSQVGDKKIYYGSVTVRVPAAQLNSALDQIKAKVTDPKNDVLDENISGEDVTSTVVDLESRLKNYQATQAQLLHFMDKATKTQDALDVLNQLTAIQEQIELLQGQIKYYNESAAMSAITVTVQPKIPDQPVTVEGWKPLVILRDAAQTLVEILKGLYSVLVYVIILLGPFALIFFLIYWLVWLSRKKQGWTRKGLKFYRPGTLFTPPAIPAKAPAKKSKK